MDDNPGNGQLGDERDQLSELVEDYKANFYKIDYMTGAASSYQLSEISSWNTK